MARLDRLNAAVGALRSRLLGREGLRALALRSGLDGRLAMLRDGPWGATLPPGDRPSLEELESGLREAQRREGARLLAWAEGRPARAVLEAFLGLSAGDAMTALLRGLAAGATPARILAAAPPVLPAVEHWLRQAAGAGSIEVLLERLRTEDHPLAGPLAEAFPLQARLGLWPLEAAVTRATSAAARKAVRRFTEDGRVLAGHLGDRTDLANAALLLTLAGAGPQPDAAQLALPGGRRLSTDAVLALAGALPETVSERLSDAFGTSLARPAPWGSELALEGALARLARREARARPFSVAVPMAYLLDRRAEARRIALLLRGSAVEVPPEELLELLEA